MEMNLSIFPFPKACLAVAMLLRSYGNMESCLWSMEYAKLLCRPETGLFFIVVCQDPASRLVLRLTRLVLRLAQP